MSSLPNSQTDQVVGSVGALTESTLYEEEEQLIEEGDELISDDVDEDDDPASAAEGAQQQQQQQQEETEDTKDLLPCNYLRAFLVSCWDNTVGPKTLKTWCGTGGAGKRLENELSTFISRFTVTDEVSREQEIGRRVEIKFTVLQDAGILVFTSVFRAKYGPVNRQGQRDLHIFTTSLVVDCSLMQRFVALNSVVRERIIALSKYLIKLCSRFDTVDLALETFEEQLREFVAVFDALMSTDDHTLPPFIDSTLFRDAPESKADRDFLARVLTSHLQTHCCSVVVGSSLAEVNLWVDTLSLFVLPSERALCRRADDKHNFFIPELFVQGLLLPGAAGATAAASTAPPSSINSSLLSEVSSTPPQIRSINMQSQLQPTPAQGSGVAVKHKRDQWLHLVPMRSLLLRGKYPVTIVDLVHKQVLHFRLFNYFVGLKKDLMDSEHGHGHAASPVAETLRTSMHRKDLEQYRSYFVHASSIAPCVRKIMDRAFSIPPNLRVGLVLEFMRDVARRALALAQYVDRSLSARNDEIMDNFIEKIKESMDLKDSIEELNIVLAAAEKITPGVYIVVAGDPQEGAEAVTEFLNEF